MNATRQERSPAGGETVELVSLATHGVWLCGELVRPAGARGLVVLPQAEAGGASGPRATYLARLIRLGGFATLVCDLSAGQPAELGHDVSHDAERMATRLGGWIALMRTRAALAALPLGIAAAECAGAAAFIAAMRDPRAVRAVATIAARADLVSDALPGVTAPTLLLAGEFDHPAAGRARRALARLRCPRRLELLPGARHTLGEPGSWNRVAVAIRRWMRRYLDTPALPALGVGPRLAVVSEHAIE